MMTFAAQGAGSSNKEDASKLFERVSVIKHLYRHGVAEVDGLYNAMLYLYNGSA